jgi:hypothetical protein
MPPRDLSSFPSRFAEIFQTAMNRRISITLPSHQDALRLRWRFQRFRQCHPKTHEARLLTFSVRRQVLTIFRRDIIPSNRIEETPQ